MANKPNDKSDTQASSAMSPQQVWLAGLGAMAQAQARGTKAFEALVSDGLSFQRKSQEQAQQRLHEATEQLSSMAHNIGQQASGRIDKLEHLFEDRVAKALQRLGMPSLADIAAMHERISALEAQLQSATQPAAVAKPPAKTAAKAAAKKAPARKTATAARKKA